MGCDVEASDSSISCLQQLMSRYQQADGTAVRLLIERLSPQLLRFFSSQMGRKTDAEDMLQDLWIRIHRALCVVNTGSGNGQTLEVAVGSAISEEYAIRRSLRQVASRRSFGVFSHLSSASD